MPRPRPLWRFGSLIALAVVTLAACGHGDTAPDSAPSPPPPTVVVQTMKTSTVAITQDFVGTTASIQDVNILARVKGTLEHVYFKEGALVRKGQLLFSLQKDKYQADVESAQANLLKAKAQLYEAQESVPVLQAAAVVEQNKAKVGREQLTVNRVVPLGKLHAVPQSDVDNATQNLLAAQADLAASIANLRTTRVTQTANIETAQAAVLSAKADLANAELNLSYCTIASPVTGIIGFLKFDVGNVVGDADSQVLDTVSTIDPIKVLFSADENTYLALAGRSETYDGEPLRDQPVSLLLSNNKMFDYKGTLYTVGRTLDTKTGTITVEARFPNPEGYLRPGQFGRVHLVTDQVHDALLVPQVAVVQTQGANNAYVVDKNDVAQQRSLSLGPIYGDSYLVNSGLTAGDRIIVQGVQKAIPGKKVVVASAPAK
jgi:membrane fusion protein (multidrug efflux system)